MRYRRVRVISGKGSGPGGFEQTLRGLALGPDERLYAVGDSEVKVFSRAGQLVQVWDTERPGYSVAVAADGRVYVGQPGQVQLFDGSGKLVGTWRDADRLGLVTAIGFAGEYVLLADAKDRCIRRYDGRGKYVGTIGKDNRMKGFLIPNGHLDFGVDGQRVIHAVNPGKHRVERYGLGGKLLGHFGRFDGRDPAGFGGCCNPTNIAVTRGGQVVVTEKAGPRVKVYGGDGELRAVMGEEDFDASCKNMDVVVDSEGYIYVADTVRLHICVFALEEAAVATQPGAPADREVEKP